MSISSLRIFSGLSPLSVAPNDAADLRRSLEENELKELRQNPFFREQISGLNREQNLNLNTSLLYPLLRDDGGEPTIQVRDRTGKLWGIPVTDPDLRSIHKRYMERCFGPALEAPQNRLPSTLSTTPIPALANTIPIPDPAPQREQLQLRDEIQGLEERLRGQTQERQENTSRIQELERALQSSQENAQNSQRELTQLQAENKRFQEESASLNSDLRSARGKLEALERTSLGEHRELLEFRARVRELEQRIHGLEIERARNLGRIQELESTLVIERAERGRIQRDLQEALRQNGRLEEQNRQLNADLDHARRNLLHLEQRVVPELQHRIGNLQQNQYDLSYQRDSYQFDAESLGRQNTTLRRNLERANGLASESERLRHLLAQRELELEQLRPVVGADGEVQEEPANLQREFRIRSAAPADQVELESLAESQVVAQAECNDLRQQLLRVTTERNHIVKATTRLLAHIRSANGQLNTPQASVNELTARIDTLATQHAAAQATIRETTERLAKAQRQADQLAPTQRALLTAQASVRDLTGRLEGLTAVHDATQARMLQARAQLRDAQRLAKDLEPTQRHLAEAHAAIKLLIARVRVLAEEQQTATAELEHSRELLTAAQKEAAQLEQTQRQLSTAQASVKTLTDSIAALNSQHEADQATVRETQLLLSEPQSQAKQLESTQQQLRAAQASAQTLTSRVAELTEEQRVTATELERNRELLAAVQAKADQLAPVQAENQALRTQLETVCSQHQADMATLKREHQKHAAAAAESLRGLQQSLTEKTDQLALVEATIKEKHTDLEAAQSRAALLEPAQRDLQAARAEITALTSRMRDSEQDQTALKAARVELAAAVERASQLERVEQESAQAQETVQSLRGELRELTVQHERVLATFRETETRLAATSDQYTQAQALIAEQQTQISLLEPRVQKAERGLEEALGAVKEAESLRRQSEARVVELEPSVKKLEEAQANVEAQQRRITELSAQHEEDVIALRSAEAAAATAKREVTDLVNQKKALAQTANEENSSQSNALQLEQRLAERERELAAQQALILELSPRAKLLQSEMAEARAGFEQAQKRIAELEPKAQEWERLTAELRSLQQKSIVSENYLLDILTGIEASEPAALNQQLNPNSLEERVRNAQRIIRIQQERELALQARNKELLNSFGTLSKEYEQNRTQRGLEHQSELQRIKREAQGAADESQRTLHALRDKLAEEADASHKKIAALQESLNQLTTVNQRLDDRREATSADNIQKQDRIERLERAISQSKEQLLKTENTLREVTTQLEKLHAQNEELQKKIDSLERDLNYVNKDATGLRGQVSERDEQIDTMRKDLAAHREQLREYFAARELLDPAGRGALALLSLPDEIRKLQTRITELTTQLETQEAEINARIMEEFGQPLKAQIDGYQNEIARLKLEITANQERAAHEKEILEGWVETHRAAIDRHDEILTRMQARNRELTKERLKLFQENEQLRAQLAKTSAQTAEGT